MIKNDKVILITGASSGIGKSTAEYFFKNGYKVFGTSRKANYTKKENGSGFLEMIPLDVTNEESAENAINYIVKKMNRIDILINNAGFGIAGAIEDTSIEEAKRQLETNFFGTMRMINKVLPIMRKQMNGRIINLSSVAGVISIPYQSMYSVSKYSIEALTEALRIEVKPFNIKVSMVEPGDTKTGFTDKRMVVKNAKNSIYNKTFTKSVQTMEHDERNGVSPEKVTKVIVKLVNKKNPPIRSAVGFSYKAICFCKKILPARFFEFVVSKIYA